jgi:aminoglycoside phosphotransferase (APT) family kinase protein
MDTEVAVRLHRFVAAQLGDVDFEISALTPIGVGRSRDNWTFGLRRGGSEGPVLEELVLRTDPDGGLVQTDRRTEFAVLRALEPTDLPTPRP